MVGRLNPEAGQKKRASSKLAGFVSTSRLVERNGSQLWLHIPLIEVLDSTDSILGSMEATVEVPPRWS